MGQALPWSAVGVGVIRLPNSDAAARRSSLVVGSCWSFIVLPLFFGRGGS